MMLYIAIVAQSVERIHGKDEVRGSIPRNGSKKKDLPLLIDNIIILMQLYNLCKIHSKLQY